MVILYCLRFVFISESGNKALMLSIDLLIELYFKMPMFNLFSEVNILECINNRNIIGTFIFMYGFSLQICCIRSLPKYLKLQTI